MKKLEVEKCSSNFKIEIEKLNVLNFDLNIEVEIIVFRENDDLNFDILDFDINKIELNNIELRLDLVLEMFNNSENINFLKLIERKVEKKIKLINFKNIY